MGKKKKLAKIHKIISNECYENKALLESLMANAESCNANCCILLEMVKRKNIKVFRGIEKSREILKITG